MVLFDARQASSGLPLSATSGAGSRPLRRSVMLGLTSLIVLPLISVVYARESPTITIRNESSERVLARLKGPTAGYISIPAGGSHTVEVRGGNYVALFRYGEEGRYSYTKIGPFDVVETPSQVSEITIVLHTVAGNTNEQPSDQSEFNGQ
jgi:hypothetical protein